MPYRLMILPATVPEEIRVLKIPSDMETQEAYRHVTAIIAQIEQQNPDADWEDLAEALEERNFIPQDCVLGPEL
ncbi:MAG: hypothetical protein HY940_09410 [Gammaproteobacteria bacterium]|nr:hypothetical protein [Gammaproteobacteria bacterium]